MPAEGSDFCSKSDICDREEVAIGHVVCEAADICVIIVYAILVCGELALQASLSLLRFCFDVFTLAPAGRCVLDEGKVALQGVQRVLFEEVFSYI